MRDLQSLCAQVRQTAYDIHLYHGHGDLEKVYVRDAQICLVARRGQAQE
jgi:hypothetical protein